MLCLNFSDFVETLYALKSVFLYKNNLDPGGDSKHIWREEADSCEIFIFECHVCSFVRHVLPFYL